MGRGGLKSITGTLGQLFEDINGALAQVMTSCFNINIVCFCSHVVWFCYAAHATTVPPYPLKAGSPQRKRSWEMESPNPGHTQIGRDAENRSSAMSIRFSLIILSVCLPVYLSVVTI